MFLLFVLTLVCVMLIIVFAFLVLTLIYVGWRRVISQKSYCHVKFEWKEPCLVGEPLSFRISVGKSRSYSSSDNITPTISQVQESDGFLRGVAVEIRQALVYHATHKHSKIEYVKEIDPQTGEIVVKFSVRNSGLYLITVTHGGVRAVGSPFRKRFKPCQIDASKTTFLRPSPTLLCIAGEDVTHEVQPRDKYGNDCDESIWINAEKSVESRLKFISKFADENCADNAVSSDEVSHVFITRPDGGRIEFILYVSKPGVYKGQILYDDKPIASGQFDILSVTSRENLDMLHITNNNPAWTPHQGNLSAIGDEVQPKQRKVYLYVSPKLLYVQEYFLKVIPFKLATYRVSPMTKIRMIRKGVSEVSTKTGMCEEYTFAVSDGVQPQVTVQMETSKARTMLALYVSFLQKRLGGSENFEGKQRVFYQELRGSMKDLRLTSKQILITRASLVYTSMNMTKYFRKSDWCKNFGIKFENENGYDYGGLRREWLELLCVQFFQNNVFGMFSSIGTSRLVHPTVSTVRYPLWTLKHYEFAGKVVGKCLFESSCGDVYTQMVKAKFSRSFLAQVLGIPPNYQHFEQDDPELFLSKVKYILENDVTDMELTFSEEEYDNNGRLKKTVELIPGGAKKKVTAENKEQYLNALALYRLSSRVTKEIDAFKRGLTEIVPEELLTSFDENELELLLCGRSEFDIEDLKSNLVIDWSWGGPTQKKLFSWFCAAVANMNDDERGRLLQFTTGSSLLPHGGFKALSPKFKISISSEHGKLPKAHTCFNAIVLSDHDNYENFLRALLTAITEGNEGFSFT